VENPGTWFALVQVRARTGEKLIRKKVPPAALVQNEGDEPGGKRRAELTAGGETGARRNGQSIGIDLEVPMDAVRGEAGTDLGSSDLPIKRREVRRGSLDQAQKPWSDVSVPEKIWPIWQEVQ
jgi:hypothetical protein